jgi:predicted RecA/RadA family phage recombinase
MSLRHQLFCAAALSLLAVGAQAQSAAFGRGAPASQAGFGGAVAIAGSDILVGEAENEMRSGLVYVYRRGQNGWAEAAQVAASDNFTGDGFGASIDVSGSSMIVGATLQNERKGAAYVFTRGNDGAWTQSARITADSATEGGQFGASVAMAGDWAFVAAPGESNQAGAVYVFQRRGNAWSQTAKLTATAIARSFFALPGP